MNKWTPEQEEAINKDGTNIIVSAGAGSGKTMVLTARVIRKLKEGVNKVKKHLKPSNNISIILLFIFRFASIIVINIIIIFIYI